MGFLVLTLCVPMNTVFAEGTNGHSKEVQSISLQEDSQKEEKSENEDLQVPTESVKGENIDDSGKRRIFRKNRRAPGRQSGQGDGIFMKEIGIMPKNRIHYILVGFI